MVSACWISKAPAQKNWVANMRKSIIVMLIHCLLFSSLARANEVNYYYDGTGKYNCETYDYKQSQRLGKTAQESSATAINLSMLGWGIGLAAGIAILAALVHQSKASTAHSTSTTQ